MKNLLKTFIVMLTFSTLLGCDKDSLKQCNNCDAKNSMIKRYGQFGEYYVCKECGGKIRATVTSYLNEDHNIDENVNEIGKCLRKIEGDLI